MSRLYVPAGLQYRQYLNMATINGMDIGSGTPVYERGVSTKDWTVKTDLWTAPSYPASLDAFLTSPEYRIEYGSFGSRFSFQLTYESVIFFEILTILNPPNTTQGWTASREYLDLFLTGGPIISGAGGARVYYHAASNVSCGPFVSEFAVKIPAGETNLYIAAAWANSLSTQSGNRHIASRVNFIGYKT